MSEQNAKEISLEEVNAILKNLSLQTQVAFKQQNYALAEQLLLKVVSIAPKHPLAWMDLTSASLRQKNHEVAYERGLKTLALMGEKVDTNLYDALAEICHELNKTEEYLHYGRLAIESKKQMVKDEPQLTIPKRKPPKFTPKKPQQNVISYSLFGNLPRYGETAVLNMQLAKEIYPEWSVRFYVDETVPQSVIERLEEQGAKIFYVNEEQKQLSGLYWRFFVMDDPNVKRFLIRDADSFLSYRERAAVDAWLASDRWFHTMHDSYSHTELVLAGMWGGCTGIFKNVQESIEAFNATGNFLNSRVMDQHYLRYCVWPTLKQNVLIHDSQGYEPLGVPFPTASKKTSYEHDARFHVGANEASSIVTVTFAHAPSKEISLYLKDQQQKVIFHYDLISDFAPQIKLQLPVSYADKIKTEEWYIATQAKPQLNQAK